MERTRRAYLASLGTVGIAGLAGCSRGEATSTGTPRPTVEGTYQFDGYLAPTANFDGSVVDARGQSETTVKVGASGNGGYRAYAPAAVAVDTGTTVVWEWTGRGGGHNVVSESPAFESELILEAGHVFEHTFDSAGVYKYYCTPHLRTGMKGVVAVGDVL